MNGPTELNRRRLLIGAIIGLAALGGLYFLIPKLAGLNQTWGQLKHGDPVMLGVGALLELVSIAGYALLFATVFGRGASRITWRAAIQIPLAGIAAIRLLAAAGAGGVAVTVWALRRAGMDASVIACRMVASYVIQYFVYLAAIVGCGLGLHFGVFAGGGPVELTLLPAVLSAGAIVLVASMAFVPGDFRRRLEGLSKRKGRVGRLAARLASAPEVLGSGVRTAIDLLRERRIGLIGAFIYWGFDIAVLGLSFRAFGSVVPLAVLIMGYFLGTLGSLLPLPGGIGGVEGGMIGAFVAFGLPGGRAVVAVLAYRAISFWLPTLPGIVGYLSLRKTVRRWQAADQVHGEDPPSQQSTAVAARQMGRRQEAPSFGQLLWRLFSSFIHWLARLIRGEVVRRVGGPARARVIVLFAAVLALNGADTATVGAVAPQLETALHIGDTKIGLLSAVTLLVGAVFTIPVGLFVDRARRMPLLAFSIVLWSLASLVSAFAGSYSSLLLTRLALGAVAATAGPAIASLTGDYFPAKERGRVYAYILGGEVAGSAVGFIISGSVASLIDWRLAFHPSGHSGLLPGPGALAHGARAPPRRAEPVGAWSRRSGAGRRRGSTAGGRPAAAPPPRTRGGSGGRAGPEGGRAQGARPNPHLVLSEDPQHMGLVQGDQVPAVDPQQCPDDHRLLAGLLLLLRAPDVRVDVRGQPLQRGSGHGRARVRPAGRGRPDRHPGQRTCDRHDAPPGEPFGPSDGPCRLLLARRDPADSGLCGHQPDARTVV